MGNKDRVQIIVSGIVFPVSKFLRRLTRDQQGDDRILRHSGHDVTQDVTRYARLYAIVSYDGLLPWDTLVALDTFARIHEFSIPTLFLSFLSVSVYLNYWASNHLAMCVLHLSRIISRVALKSTPANFVLSHRHRCYLV